MIRVLVNGALGRMGSEVVKKDCAEADLELAAVVDVKEASITLDTGAVMTTQTDLEAAIKASTPDVVVDFTRPDVVMNNLRKVLKLGVRAVVGTTGFKQPDLDELDALAKENNTALLIAPNFALGAVVMMKLACEAAKRHGVTVSVDLNFRKKLWSSAKAQKVMTNLMQYVDVCIGNEEDAEKVLGFKPGNTDVTSGELELAGYKSIFEQMVEKFNFEYVISSLRVICCNPIDNSAINTRLLSEFNVKSFNLIVIISGADSNATTSISSFSLTISRVCVPIEPVEPNTDNFFI